MKSLMVRTQTFRGLFAGLGVKVLLAALLAAAPFHAALAATAPPLGTAQTYGVVAGDTVTNVISPGTLVTGDLGVSPGSVLTGFPPGVVTGATELGNAVSLQAKSDARTAYNNLTSQACTTTYLVPTDLTLVSPLGPGVYCFASSASLSGTLVLQGTASDVWIFKTVSTLTTGSGSSVVMDTTGGWAGQACNVFWQIGSSATLGTTTSFIGNILAFTSISLNTDANVSGRALAGLAPGGGGAVTMDSNLVTPAACSTAVQPALVKVFDPNTIAAGGNSTLTITLSNSNSTPVTGASLTDILPAGVTFLSNATTDCTGALLTSGDTVTLTGGSIPANGFCTVTAVVTSSVVGPHNNTAALTTNQGSASASDTLTVFASASQAPTLSKTFFPNTINAGSNSLLTITLGNTNATAANFAVFTDTLPIGVTFVSSATNNGCGGTIANDAFTVTLTNGSIPANGSCTVTATVTSLVPGLHLNTTGVLVTDKGTAPAANDTLIVNETSPIGIIKSFTPPIIGAGGASLLTITVSNPNIVAIPVAFTDLLPSSPGPMLVATGPGPLINTCGGTLTATTGSSSVIYAGGLLPAGGSCTVTVYVTALIVGNYTNFLGTANASLTVSPTIPPQPGLLLEKTATPTTYTKKGDIIVYTYIIKNTGGVTLTGPFTVTDDKLGTFTCGTGSLAPGASVTCTKNYTIQAGDLGNVTSLPTGITANINTGAWMQGVKSIQDTTITNAGLGVPNGIYPAWCIQDHVSSDLHNQSAKLYSTIGGSLPADVALQPWNKVNYILNHKIGVPNTLQFIKDVQTAIWVVLGEPHPEFGISANAQAMIDAANANPNFVPGSGEVVAVIIYSDGMLPVNYKNRNQIQESICEMRQPKTIINHATAHNAVVQSGQVQATVYQTVLPPPAPIAPTLAKAFSPATINAGGISTLTITLNNLNSTVASLTAPLTDYFPSGVVIANPANAGTTCGGTLTATTGSPKVTLTGGSIPANGSCTVKVKVTAKYMGSYYNKLPAGALQTNKGSNAAPAAATLTVNRQK